MQYSIHYPSIFTSDIISALKHMYTHQKLREQDGICFGVDSLDNLPSYVCVHPSWVYSVAHDGVWVSSE